METPKTTLNDGDNSTNAAVLLQVCACVWVGLTWHRGRGGRGRDRCDNRRRHGNVKGRGRSGGGDGERSWNSKTRVGETRLCPDRELDHRWECGWGCQGGGVERCGSGGSDGRLQGRRHLSEGRCGSGGRGGRVGQGRGRDRGEDLPWGREGRSLC